MASRKEFSITLPYHRSSAARKHVLFLGKDTKSAPGEVPLIRLPKRVFDALGSPDELEIIVRAKSNESKEQW